MTNSHVNKWEWQLKPPTEFKNVIVQRAVCLHPKYNNTAFSVITTYHLPKS